MNVSTVARSRPTAVKVRAGQSRAAHDGGHASYAYRAHKQNAWIAICRFRFASGSAMAHKCCVLMPQPPSAHGLYDPRHEHDACGVGFVVHVKGRRSHAIVRQALQVLINLRHRGACGCEANTGDGAGILIQMPDRFLRKEAARLGIALPPERYYGAGLVFLPRDDGRAAAGRGAHRADRRARKGSACSAGATCRPTTPRSGRARWRSSRSSGRSSSGAAPTGGRRPTATRGSSASST